MYKPCWRCVEKINSNVLQTPFCDFLRQTLETWFRQSRQGPSIFCLQIEACGQAKKVLYIPHKRHTEYTEVPCIRFWSYQKIKHRLYWDRYLYQLLAIQRPLSSESNSRKQLCIGHSHSQPVRRLFFCLRHMHHSLTYAACLFDGLKGRINVQDVLVIHCLFNKSGQTVRNNSRHKGNGILIGTTLRAFSTDWDPETERQIELFSHLECITSLNLLDVLESYFYSQTWQAGNKARSVPIHAPYVERLNQYICPNPFETCSFQMQI